MTLGVRGAVVDGEGRVLLLRHTYTPGWHMPGGGVERGETALLALQRELVEEAGVEAKAEDIRLVSVHANSGFFPNDHVLLFRIDRWRQVRRRSGGKSPKPAFSPQRPCQRKRRRRPGGGWPNCSRDRRFHRTGSDIQDCVIPGLSAV
jgi:8-oxo-dGTP pyrophosphatase MutT (NUDIX family)